MTHFVQATKEAVAHGWRQPEPCDLEGIAIYHKGDALIDPTFWQSLGKARGWGEDENNRWDERTWANKWHAFINFLSHGGDAESFFKDL